MTFWELIKRITITRKCLLCNEPISYDEKEPFCENCILDWQSFLDAKCHRCGYKSSECTCLPRKIRAISPYGAVYCVFYDAKSNFKFNGLLFKLKRDLNRDLIDFCAQKITKNLLIMCKRHSIDYKAYSITYVTRRKKGSRKYGFDHAELLACSISKKLGIKLEKTIINNGTLEQKSLTKVEREENANESYELYEKANVKNKSYFLVDDIITSGATMKACATILKDNGANEIFPISFAKDNR